MHYNIPVEFIHRKDLEGSDLSQYKLIITPFPVMFTQQAADGLKSFIEKGGFVVSEARMAWNDERGYATEIIPGLGLSEVFGIRESKVEVKDSVPIKIMDTNHPAFSRLRKGDKLDGKYFAESITPLLNQQTKIFAYLEDGTPCISASSYGRGETLFVGSFLDNHPEFNEKNNQFILGLIDWAGVDRPFTSSHDGRKDAAIVIRLHENPDGLLMYVLNQGESPQEVSINLKVNAKSRFHLREIIKGISKIGLPENGIIEWKTGTISGSDVEIWSITSESKIN